MKIKRMTASFGCLENETLTLDSGLNVIYSPNESGKSTWCAFIRAMLYGIDSSQREKNGVKPDKTRYAPWSGAPMWGEMEIEYRGSSITISRKTSGQSGPMRDFTAVYTGTAQPVKGLTGTNAGEMLTGMSRAVFDDTVFVRQAGLGVSGSPELERRIASLVSTGEETGSYSEAEERLRAWQRKRRFRQSGALPELEREMDVLRTGLSELESAVKERNELAVQLDKKQQQAEVLRDRAEMEALERRRLLVSDMERSRDRAAQASAALAEAQEKALSMQAELENGPFSGAMPEDAGRAAQADVKELETLRHAMPKCWAILLFLLLGAGAAAAGALWLKPMFIAAAAAFAAAAALCFMWLRRRKALKRQENYLRRKYSSPHPDEIYKLCGQYGDDFLRWAEAKGAVQRAEEGECQAKKALAEAERVLLADTGGSGQYRRLLDEVQAECGTLRQELAVFKGRFSALGDPMVMTTELGDMTARHAELCAQYDALELALSELEQANDEMQQRFSPELGRRASAIMLRLTGGRYDRLAFDRSLNARARASGGPEHEMGFLSSGTADQIYLALRLALSTLSAPDGAACPLILDDALVNFDDERMKSAVDVLREMSEHRQVILFSCSSREQRYLKGTGAE